jgi:hypothetical protein
MREFQENTIYNDPFIKKLIYLKELIEYAFKIYSYHRIHCLECFIKNNCLIMHQISKTIFEKLINFSIVLRNLYYTIKNNYVKVNTPTFMQISCIKLYINNIIETCVINNTRAHLSFTLFPTATFL